MRLIILRRPGECAKCASALAEGAQAGYERGCGIYCPPCIPTDPEEIRTLRQAANDRKANRREEWAKARDRRAASYQGRSDSLMRRDPLTGRADWALVTQPGHIPQRVQANRAQEKVWDEQAVASHHRGIAAALRAPVAVKGDAAARHDARLEIAKARTSSWLRVGVMVIAHPFQGPRRVVRLNKKSVSVDSNHGCVFLVCYSAVEQVKE